MSEEIKIQYHEVTITYDEGRNRFVYETDGRERSSESLALAKVAIDKPDSNPKTKFSRFAAFYKAYNEWKTVEVTSIAESGYEGLVSCWIVIEGRRQKVAASDLCKHSAENKARIEEWGKKSAQRAELIEQMRALELVMTRISIPKE